MTDSPKLIKPPDEKFLIHCPKLGHQLPFSYCRSENMGAPCFKILDCWFRYFPVEKYLRCKLSAEEWSKAFEEQRASKVVTLAELIDKAKAEEK